jgi:enamine deaminase RidA (YjgF/YER057c/UK114 family)
MMILNPPTLAPPIMPVYSQISIAPAGALAFIAGQVAIDRDGQLIGKNDHRLQSVQCFRNIAAALEALDAQPHQLVRMTINVVHHRDELASTIFEAGREVFQDQWPICASIFLGVQALGHSDWLVEVDGIVSLPAFRPEDCRAGD